VRPDADVVVDCHTPGQSAVLLRRCHPHLIFVDTVWRICFHVADLPPVEAAGVARGIVADAGRMPKIAAGIDLLARADTIHLVGGGYVNAVWSHHMALLAAAVSAAERSGGRALATGQGLVPVGEHDRLSLLRDLQARFDLFDVRDGPSFEAITGSGGHESYTCDDAWLGIGDGGVYDTASAAAHRAVVFCLQSDLMEDFAGGEGAEGLARAITRLIAQWQLTGGEVAVVEGIPGADRVVFDRVADQLPGAIFVPFTTVWNDGLPARSGQVWVSTRFHPHLLAAAAGASGLALAGRSDYYPTKHQSLIDAGSHWQMESSSELPADPVRDGGFSSETVQFLERRKVAQANQLYPPAHTSVRRAADAIRLLGRR
jgi:polysaccharide pyruvyl transferase WcaK-like protein